jgi:hypothetical protein
VKAKVCLIKEDCRIADVFFVVYRESGIGPCAGYSGKTLCADGVEGSVSVASVRKKDNCWSSHRAGSFWGSSSVVLSGWYVEQIHNGDLRSLCMAFWSTLNRLRKSWRQGSILRGPQDKNTQLRATNLRVELGVCFLRFEFVWICARVRRCR